MPRTRTGRDRVFYDMRRQTSIQLALPLAVALFLCVLPASGQISTATLVGAVHDAAGGVVGGARVEAKNAATGRVRSTARMPPASTPCRTCPPGTIPSPSAWPASRRSPPTTSNCRSPSACSFDARLEVGAIGPGDSRSPPARRHDRHGVVFGRPCRGHRTVRAHAAERPQLLATHADHPRRELHSRRPGHAHRRQIHPFLGRQRHDQRHRPDLDRLGPRWLADHRDADRRHAHSAQRRRHPGVQGRGLQHARRVRPHSQRHQCHAEERHEPVSRHAFRISAQRQARCAQLLLHPARPDRRSAIDPLRRNQYGGTFGGPSARIAPSSSPIWSAPTLREGQDFNNVVPTERHAQRRFQLAARAGASRSRSSIRSRARRSPATSSPPTASLRRGSSSSSTSAAEPGGRRRQPRAPHQQSGARPKSRATSASISRSARTRS